MINFYRTISGDCLLPHIIKGHTRYKSIHLYNYGKTFEIAWDYFAYYPIIDVLFIFYPYFGNGFSCQIS